MTAAEGMGQARGVPPSPPKHLETLPPVIDNFDGIINGEVKTFVNMSEEIGGLVAEQVPTPKHRILEGVVQLQC